MSRWPLIVALLCAPLVAQASSPPVAAVAEIASEVALSGDARAALQARLRARLAARRALRLIPPDHVRDARRQLRTEALRRCDGGDCAVALGKELAAAKVVVARITTLAGHCLVSVKLFDIASATAETAAAGRGACTPAALLETLSATVARLRLPAAPTAPAVRPSGHARADGNVSVYVSSRPIAAPVLIDGEQRGLTPVRLSLAAGQEFELQVGAWPMKPVRRRIVARPWQRLVFGLRSDERPMATNTEYLSFGFGGGAFLDHKGGGLFAATMRIATLKWRWFFLTAVEGRFAGGGNRALVMLGPRAGLPLSLGRAARHQLLLGTALHVASYDPGKDESEPAPGKMFALAPGIDYVYQASGGKVPLTVSASVELPLAGELGGRPPYLFMASLRVGLSLTPVFRAMRRSGSNR